jgi:rRNA maturation RNase YbeY
MNKPKVLVLQKTYQRKWRIDRPAVSKFLEKSWQLLRSAAPLPARNESGQIEVGIVFLNGRQMQWYNKMYRNKDYPTDVLSFPVNESVPGEGLYLGDILISMQNTAEQASQKGHSLGTELQILLLHGMIHLLGYDHETDSGEMDRLERRLRKHLIRPRSLTL